MKKRKTLLIIAWGLLALTVHGQNTSRQTWSLNDCIDHALKHNLDVRLHHLDLQRAGHDVTQSYASVFPYIDAGTNAGFNYGRTIDEVTNEFFTERIASQRIQATAGVNIFSGFRTINNIRYHLSRQTALRLDVEKRENDLILTIANAYLQILYFKDMLEVKEQQAEVSRQQLERVRVFFEGGTLSRGDVLDMEAIVAEDEVRATSARNNRDLAYLELQQLLELDPDQEFVIERPRVAVEETPVLFDPDLVLERALAREPSVAAARERIAMAENGVAIRKGQRAPTLSLYTSLGTAYSEAFKRPENAGASYRDIPAGTPATRRATPNEDPAWETIPYRDQLRENYYRSIQLSLSIPVFNNLQSRTRIEHARIDLDQAQLWYHRTKNQLGQVIHQAHADATAAYKAYVSNAKALEAARESFGFSEQGFGLGIVSPVEFNEAKARLNRAETSALQSTYELVFKVKILEFYQGEGFSL